MPTHREPLMAEPYDISDLHVAMLPEDDGPDRIGLICDSIVLASWTVMGKDEIDNRVAATMQAICKAVREK